VKWESGKAYRYKGDDSLRSFLFTLRHPQGIPARKFALRAEKKSYAIYCYSASGPEFGNIYVYDNCNANRDRETRWSDSTYANYTAVENFFTGAEKFTVREMAVFEIAN
jgi:hypothetical protein